MSESKQTIKLENLGIGYRGKHGVKEVASGINASLYAGELTCLIGPNGVGKSTLMRTVCAFQEKLGGNIVIDGKELEAYPDKELSKKIGVVLTHRPQIQNMNVEELVALGRSPYTGFWGKLEKEDRKIVSDAISLIGIDNLRSRMIQNLSDGERQKVMIAKAIAQQTPIICLDEPTAFLDFPSKIETMQLLKKLAKENGKTIFLSTHDLELTLQIADRIWLMQKGNITIGTPEEVAQSGALSEFIEREGITFDKSQMRVKISR
ncbi:MAG: ABC transporter ATP-binding protein [Bacteroidales bacterium]|nr:ABC transporter ATP-binding protein [Bacteroidales bacterium]